MKQTFTVMVDCNRYEGGVWRKVPCKVLLGIDMEALARDLGSKALRNKTKVAKECHGVIEAKATPR